LVAITPLPCPANRKKERESKKTNEKSLIYVSQKPTKTATALPFHCSISSIDFVAPLINLPEKMPFELKSGFYYKK